MLDKSAQAGQHSYKERGDDLYETPACATEALLRIENIPHFVWEPACGPGAIVKVLREHGHSVFGSDLNRYDNPTCYYERDFFYAPLPKHIGDIGAIVTNPPYQHAADFVRHALGFCPYVAMLLRLAFYESECRSDILDVHPPAKIHVFKKRLPMMHRAGWKGKKASSAIAFAWFVWDEFYKGKPTIIDRISWE